MAKPFAVIDLETDPFLAGRLPAPFCAGFYDGDFCQTYWGDGCIAYLIEDLKEFDGFVYAHNGGKFDFHFLLEHIESDKIKIINGRIAEMKVGKATLRDSFLILPVPLAAHNKTEIDYAKFERGVREKHRAEILKYQTDDCHDLYNFIERFFERFPRQLTLPGIAIKQLETACGKVPRLSKKHDERMRPFYYGGRVECLESGEIPGPLTFIDINSAYPSAMQDFHPVGDGYTIQSTIPSDPVKARCSFYRINGVSRGAAPMRKKDGGISFGTQAGEFLIGGHELMAGLETGTLDIHSIAEVRVPDKVKSFAPFVNKFYREKLAAKKAGDKTTELFSKLMLNSAYGKFAANPEKYKDYDLCSPGKMGALQDGYDLETTEFGPWWLWSRPIDTDGPRARYFDVATAASITGWVRAFMWRSLNAVERPIYCDTDSILCESVGDLKLGDALGEWSVEATIKEAHIAGKKLYAMRADSGEWKTASKGVRATPEQIIAAARGETVKVYKDAPTYSAKSAPRFINREIRNTVNLGVK